jgi:hypothetical protein
MPGASRQGFPSAHFRAGVLAALAAEAVFVIMVAGSAWLRGIGPWRVFRMPASFVVGPEAVQPSGFAPGDILLSALHVLLSILVGLLYAFLLPRLGLSPLAGGLLAGLLLYLLGFWPLPLVLKDWLAPFWLPPVGRALQLVAHIVYGAALGASFRRLVQA